jgi:Histone deacetylase domain
LAHSGEHIRNYFAPPPWYQPSALSKAVTRLPSSPPSSTGSVTTTTIAESTRTTPPLPVTEDPEDIIRSDDEKRVTFMGSSVKIEYEQDFHPLESPTGGSFRDIVGMSLQKRRASGLDMDLMNALAAEEDVEIETKPSVWPVTLTHMMGCGELAIGIPLSLNWLIIAVDTTFDPERSPKEARLATGSLLNLCDAVITGRVKNGFALIRPPGHHAEPDGAMGFCIYNNVGVAAKWVLQRFPNQVKRILIIDWDVQYLPLS